MRSAEGHPGDAAREDDGEAGAHGGDGGQVAAIEAALREIAGDEGGDGIAHEISAGRPKQARETLRKDR